MDKIKSFFQKKSIRSSFTEYMLACIVAAIFLGLVLSNACQYGQSLIYEKYKQELEHTYREKTVTGVENEQFLLGYYTEDFTSYFTPLENVLYNMLGILSFAVYPFSFVLCISITSILFYRKVIQKPLELLDRAAEKISQDNLDFTITCEKKDELGKLCQSFEKMRISLQENHYEMWRQIEERKRLNAAFSHDLRTPLTVLKGQSEMLSRYAPRMSPEKIVDTAKMMERHIARLEKYVNTMNDLQRLEDIHIDRQQLRLHEIREQLSAIGHTLCHGKEFQFIWTMDEAAEIVLDSSILTRVYENLLANAVRYAEERITVSVCLRQGSFCITVSDDGPGFSDRDLANATRPFYKAVQETDNEHFGLGLNICKILCEKHGGYLELRNDKGAVVTAVFSGKPNHTLKSPVEE